jgi:putative NADPH-quinone reductase
VKEVLRWIKAQHPHLTEDGLSMRVLIINGHPDPKASHLCDALADAYADGARAAGHEVARIDVRALEFPLLRSRHEWEAEPLPPSLQAAQNAIGHAQHLMVVFPLWLGDMPAHFKGFLEQVMRPGFAVPKAESFKSKPLAGRTARIVVTMGMPAFLYRLYYRAHSLRLLRRNVFGLVGIKTVGDAVVGSVETLTESQRARWLARMHHWGRRLG